MHFRTHLLFIAFFSLAGLGQSAANLLINNNFDANLADAGTSNLSNWFCLRCGQSGSGVVNSFSRSAPQGVKLVMPPSGTEVSYLQDYVWPGNVCTFTFCVWINGSSPDPSSGADLSIEARSGSVWPAGSSKLTAFVYSVVNGGQIINTGGTWNQYCVSIPYTALPPGTNFIRCYFWANPWFSGGPGTFHTDDPSLTTSSCGTPSPTSTSSFSPTSTRTRTHTASPSASATSTPTRTATLTPSATPTNTPTPSPSASPSSTPSATLSSTPSTTPSVTLSMTPSATPTATKTPTASVTITSTPSATLTSSASVTVTGTPSASPSPTTTMTPTASPSATPSATLSSTPSQTKSSTASVTVSSTPTVTMSQSPSPSPTPSQTSPFTLTYTPTGTPTFSFSPTPTPAPPNHGSVRVFNSAGEEVALLLQNVGLWSLPLALQPGAAAFVPDSGQSVEVLVKGPAFRFQWDGTNSQGQLVSSGIYTLMMTVVDAFGSSTTYSGSVSVLRAPEDVELSIYNSAGERVRRLSLPPASGRPLDKFVWDERGDDGRPLAQGCYLMVATRQGQGGVLVQSKSVTVLWGPALAASAPKLVGLGFGRALIFASPGSQARVYNVAGELIRWTAASASSGEMRIDLNGFAGGIYLIIVESQGPLGPTRHRLKWALNR